MGRLLERQKFTTGHFNAGGYLRKRCAELAASPHRVCEVSFETLFHGRTFVLVRFDLDALLDAGGGIARIPDFLPKKVAARVLKTLQARKELPTPAGKIAAEQPHAAAVAKCQACCSRHGLCLRSPI